MYKYQFSVTNAMSGNEPAPNLIWRIDRTRVNVIILVGCKKNNYREYTLGNYCFTKLKKSFNFTLFDLFLVKFFR